MGPWASVVVAVASLAAVFFIVMGFRGLIEAVDHFSGRCGTCARTALLPMPTGRRECWRCHYALLLHQLVRLASVRHRHVG